MLDGTLYFVANDGTSGNELWKSDGTEAGTVLSKTSGSRTAPAPIHNLHERRRHSLLHCQRWHERRRAVEKRWHRGRHGACQRHRAGARFQYPYYLTNIGGTLYFTANDGTSGTELWKSDGTDAGTIRVKDILAGSQQFVSAQSDQRRRHALLQRRIRLHDGRELWKSDGTDAGTVRVKDIRPGTSSSSPPQPDEYRRDALLHLPTTAPAAIELWKSDGTDAGTVRVKDILAGHLRQLLSE